MLFFLGLWAWKFETECPDKMRIKAPLSVSESFLATLWCTDRPLCGFFKTKILRHKTLDIWQVQLFEVKQNITCLSNSIYSIYFFFFDSPQIAFIFLNFQVNVLDFSKQFMKTFLKLYKCQFKFRLHFTDFSRTKQGMDSRYIKARIIKWPQT